MIQLICVKTAWGKTGHDWDLFLGVTTSWNFVNKNHEEYKNMVLHSKMFFQRTIEKCLFFTVRQETDCNNVNTIA